MAKKVTVTLVDDFDGEATADETVEFGLDGVTYEIDLSSKNAAKLRNDLKQWVEAGRRSVAAGADVRPDRPVAAARSIVSRVRPSANGPAATGTTCPPGAGSPPTSSTRSTPPHKRPQLDRQLPAPDR
ncbi:DNA-bridging protein Lsr2 [Mycolicibacterium conceptionense]|uniref:DNA-bridging protein Lsr2 n=1 Tax=Mycolicibacterium conceptionense TaxID=451644 RepID=A0A0U1DXM4_9MYCO|nr:DNA-bridging protein Lsr2 [Mycolicibacterium conceptionense]